jgi:WD40 repeat protein
VLAVGLVDGTVKIWDVAKGLARELLPLKGHMYSVNSLCFSPDGRQLATASAEGTVKIWQVADKEPFSIGIDFVHRGIPYIGFTPDGARIVSSAPNGDGVHIWDVMTGRELAYLPGRNDLLGLAMSPDGRLLLTASDKNAQLWDLTACKPLLDLSHSNKISAAAFCPIGSRVATACQDGTAKIWEITTGKELLTLQSDAAPAPHASEFRPALAFSPDGKHLATACPAGIVKVRDVTTGATLRSFKTCGDFVFQMTFSPDGRYIACVGSSNDFGVQTGVEMWDAETAKKLFFLKDNNYFSITFSPDSQRLAVGKGRGMADLVDTASGKVLFSRKAQLGVGLVSVAFSPDGQRLALGSGRQVTLLELADVVPEIRKARAASTLVYELFAEYELRERVLEYLGTARPIDESLRQSAIRLAQAQREDASAILARARWYTQSGQLSKALPYWLKYSDLEEQSALAHYWLALAQLGSGDKLSYRKTCNRMLGKFDQTQDPDVAHWISWSSALEPEAVNQWDRVVKMAEFAVRANPKNWQYGNNLGTVLYRAGRLEEAIQRLKATGVAWESSDSREQSCPAYTWFMLAMAQHKSQQTKDARQTLERASKWTGQELKKRNLPWNRRLTLQLFQREAELVIKEKAEWNCHI